MTAQFKIQNKTGQVLEIHSKEKLKRVTTDLAQYNKSTAYSYYQASTKCYITKYNKDEYVPILFVLSGSYAVQGAKLWGRDTGRTALSGKYTGTLIGIFPKVTMTIKGNKLFKEDARTLVLLLDQQIVNCYYYEERSGSMREAKFYFDDTNISYVKNKVANGIYNNRYGDFTITAVATEKYSGG